MPCFVDGFKLNISVKKLKHSQSLSSCQCFDLNNDCMNVKKQTNNAF